MDSLETKIYDNEQFLMVNYYNFKTVMFSCEIKCKYFKYF